jgi:hypothetical protein
MAIGIYFHPESMSKEQYEEIHRRLEAAGASAPKGRSFHSGFQVAGGNIHVYDVWDSQEDFEAFGPTLMPILADVGVDPGEPSISPIVRTIVG